MINQTRTQQANLGCGTLILIAIIVALFSRPGMDELEGKIQSIRVEITALKQIVENQTSEIKAIRNLLEQAKTD